MSNTATAETDQLPWQVKLMMALVGLLILFVVGIDLLEFAAAL